MYGQSGVSVLRIAAIWIGVAALAFLLWEVRPALLVALGATLLAIVLQLLASIVSRTTRLSRRWALVVAILVAFLAAAFCIWKFGTSVSVQFSQLVPRVEAGAATLQSLMRHKGVNGSVMGQGAAALSQALAGVVSSSVTMIEYVVIAVIAAIYLAARPELYRDGVVSLFPLQRRTQAVQFFNAITQSLRLWVLAQLLLMLFVGSLSYMTALALGLPGPIALGLVAGLTEIVPYLGPFLGAVPAILVALPQSFLLAGFVAVAYLAIHVLEGYIVGPLVQRRFAGIPPVLALMSIIVNQLVFGLGGVILAVPIAVVVYAAVRVLYLGDTPGELAGPPEYPKLSR